MTTPSAIQQSASSSALRRLIARYPVTAFLVMAYTIAPAFLLQTIWRPADILPLGFSLWDSFGTIFGVALPAFIVTAAIHGRAGIRDLAIRSLRWRVPPRWYFIALFGLPAGVLRFGAAGGASGGEIAVYLSAIARSFDPCRTV